LIKIELFEHFADTVFEFYVLESEHVRQEVVVGIAKDLQNVFFVHVLTIPVQEPEFKQIVIEALFFLIVGLGVLYPDLGED